MALLAAYSFDGSGPTVLDYSGAGNDFPLAGTTGARTTSGHTAGGLTTTGSTPPVLPNIGATATRTVMCWFKASGLDTSWFIVWNAPSIDSGAWGLLYISGQLTVQARNASGFVRAATGYPGDGGWHHAAGTYDGTNVRLYLDGTLVDTQPLTSPIRTDTDPPKLFLSQTASSIIDDLRIYDTALDQATIATQMGTPAPAIGRAYLRGTGAGYATSTAVTSGSSITIAKPANLADGDTMVATVEHQNAPPNAITSAPTGWVQVALAATTQSRVTATYIKYVPTASAETATDYTWGYSQSARIAGGIFLVGGSTGSCDAAAFSATTATLTAPTLTPSVPGGLLVYVGISNVAGGAQSFTPPAGMTEVLDVSAAPGSSTNLEVAAEPRPTTAATGTRAATISSGPAFSGGGAYVLLIRPATAVTPSLVRDGLQGMPGADTMRVTPRTANTTSARLAVSTASNMASPVFSSAAAPDADGYVHLERTGLTADTDYWWQVELDGTLTGSIGRTRTAPTPGSQASFSFAAASCCFTGSNDGVFTAIGARTGPGGRRPAFITQHGDEHYNWSASSPNGPVAPNDQAQIRAAYESSLSAANQQALYRDLPVAHCWSDNDFCGSNSDGTYAARPAVQAAWRQIMSYPTLPDAAGIYRSWVWGRVRFIFTDGRSFMSDKQAADGPSKVMFGATQRAWFADQLAQPEPVKIWLADSKWPGAPITTANSGVDYPAAFPTERATMVGLITGAAVAEQILYVAGDIHAVACDDGTNNPYGGFPFCHIAPLDQATQPYPHAVQQTYPPAGDVSNTVRHLYGWFDVDDTGDEITVAFTGYDSGGTARVSMTTVFPAVHTETGHGEGVVQVDGSATGAKSAAGAGVGTVLVVGAGGGARSAVGAGEGAVQVTGSGTGARSAAGGGAGVVAVHGVGGGVRRASGAGEATVTVTGSAGGSATRHGVGAGQVTVTGGGVGSAAVRAGFGAGVVQVLGRGGGTVIAAPAGQGHGTVLVLGTGSGSARRAGAGRAQLLVAGGAVGVKSAAGFGAGVVLVVGTSAVPLYGGPWPLTGLRLWPSWRFGAERELPARPIGQRQLPMPRYMAIRLGGGGSSDEG